MPQIDRAKYLDPYLKLHIIEHQNGYLVWRRASGYNVELLHIRTFLSGRGTGRLLFTTLLESLLRDPPYATVFGFTRTVNEASKSFYQTLGFDLSEVKGVYADGSAILFSQNYKTLLEIHNVQSTAY